MASNKPQQQVAGRSGLTIRVGSSATAANTSVDTISGCTSVQRVISPPVATAPAVAAVDAGPRGNSLQQSQKETRSAVNKSHNSLVFATFHLTS